MASRDRFSFARRGSDLSVAYIHVPECGVDREIEVVRRVVIIAAVVRVAALAERILVEAGKKFFDLDANADLRRDAQIEVAEGEVDRGIDVVRPFTREVHSQLADTNRGANLLRVQIRDVV